MVSTIRPMLTSPPFSSTHASSYYLGSTHTGSSFYSSNLVKVFQTPQDICTYCSCLPRMLWFLISAWILLSHHFSSRVFLDYSGQHQPMSNSCPQKRYSSSWADSCTTLPSLPCTYASDMTWVVVSGIWIKLSTSWPGLAHKIPLKSFCLLDAD